MIPYKRFIDSAKSEKNCPISKHIHNDPIRESLTMKVLAKMRAQRIMVAKIYPATESK